MVFIDLLVGVILGFCFYLIIGGDLDVVEDSTFGRDL